MSVQVTRIPMRKDHAMKTTELETFVKQIFSNKEKSASFRADPAEFMSRFDLTAEEKKAILATSGKISVDGSGSAAMPIGIDGIVWE